MPRTVLKMTPVSAPLPPHEQSILNSLVYTALCTEEIFSILNKVNVPEREEALRVALHWSLTRGLVDDEEQEITCDV